MDNDLEMKPTDPSGYTPSSKAVMGLSTRMMIIIACIVGGGLAIGLGVGLGVGLNNIEYVYDKPTTEPTTSGSGTVTNSTPTAPSAPGPWLNFRLPDYIIPTHYRLTLHPNMTTEDYTGTNEITLTVNQETKYVLFHAHSTLEIRSVKLMAGANELNIVDQFRWPEYEFYVVEVETELAQGEYVLTVDFYNSLVKAIVGIYKSTYIEPSGEEKGIVSSFMAPTHARRGYPCFDEPAMKIRYTTIIIHEEIHTALSNMPVDYAEDIGKGLIRTVFLETNVRMSTYIGCFVVAELGYLEDKTGRGIPLRIYGSKYQIEKGQADYALNVTKMMFDNFENLLGVNYSLPKYDQIAIPNFEYGAMENWGLVTYRETTLLWDPQDSSAFNKQRVVSVMAHEMAHQWFGNIVSFKWWNNMWLKEGFASYLEFIGMSWAEPDWILDGHFVVEDLRVAMEFDSSTGSHPMVVNVSTPSQITEIYDPVSYQKGSSILRMMNDILGNELFYGSLNRYLTDFAFSNANEQDFWNSVQAFVDEQGASFKVREILDPWVQQFGFPVVNVDTTTTADTAVVSQEIMLADAEADLTSLPDSKYGYKWNVKLEYFTETDSTVQEQWLNRTDPSADIRLPSDFGNWTKFNAGAMGYYRVNYDAKTWNAIVKQLRIDPSVFKEVDRTALLGDALNLAPAGKMPYTRALDMTSYLDMEESYFVWRFFSEGSEYIQEMLKNTDDYTNFQAYYLSKVKPIADKVGWDAAEGTHEEKRMRPYVLKLTLGYGDKEALGNATKLFAEWKAGTTYIYPDVREVVYRYGIFGGTANDWEYMLERYKGETVAGERTNLLKGLAATEDVTLIDRLLQYSKDRSIIKEQDFFNCVRYISYTVNGNRMAWAWARANWDWMVERFSLANRSLGLLIPDIIEYHNTEIQKWEVESFFDAKPEAGAGEMNRKNALIRIDLNIAWMKENAGDIGQWLKDHVDEI